MTTTTNTAYDFIVVGAGPAGIVVATRLSEDPDTKVLLVEAGGSDRRKLTLDMPAALPFAYQQQAIQWGYQSGPEPHLDDRLLDEKTGRIVGGSTAINAMLFNRGNPMDYQGWGAAGLPDWDYAHVLPYFRKLETFEGGADAWRGGDGPIHVSRSPATHKTFETFLQAGEQAGYQRVADHNGYRQEGLHVAQVFIHRGIRWNASRGYLRPAAGRPNLTLLTNALVERVEISNGSATGITVRQGHERPTITANREVILCAGAFNSPQLLMLSGVGDGDELRRHGIAVSHHLPMVGQQLEGHPGVDLQYTARNNDSLTGHLGPLGRVRLALEWAALRRGLGASNFFETGAFLRTRDDVTYPNMQYEFLPLSRKIVNGKLVPIPGFQFWMDLSRPIARGAVTLRSADPTDRPSIVFNHLSDTQDIIDLIAGVRLARTLIGQRAWDGIRGEELSPGPEVQTDGQITAYLRRRVNTSYHASGTCRMGVDKDAVVDGDARVRGLERLRVVDASIMPRIVTANLNAAVLMLAEKLADVIRGRAALPPSNADFYVAP